MNKIFLVPIIGILFCTTGRAQAINFSLAVPQPNLIGVYGGSFASGDIDGDGDQDLLAAGLDPGRETALYFNDGNGNFTEVINTPFPEASNSTTILKDLDGDGDLDLYFSGVGFGIGEFTHIYINDGSGVFTQRANPALPQFKDTGCAMEDIDNDGDQDILISVMDINGDFIADIFLNDGNANFTPKGSTVLKPVKFGSVAFVDVENDGDSDVIISGRQEDNTASIILYLNDGSGNYTIDFNSVFVQFAADDIDIADTDNDGDLDVLMSGMDGFSDVRTILYVNDGNGQFAALSSVNLQQTFVGVNAIADLDNDGDQDIIIIGSQAGGIPNIYNIVYENLGGNVFHPVDTIGGEYIAACAVDDFNGDGLRDIIIQGFVEYTNVYWNTTTVVSVQNELAEADPKLIYPNPSDGSIFVQPENDRPLSIKICSVNGVLVYQNDHTTGSEPIRLNLSNGLYLVELRSERGTQKVKLVISK